MHQDLLLGSTPEWCPPAGEVDEARRLGIAMSGSAVGVDPSGATPLTPRAVLTRFHGNSHI
nr:hypothetical protein JVH1_6916 [Rhodococcus sp. JVH1]